MAAFTAASWSDASQIVNFFGSPSAPAWSRSTCTQKAWNVPTVSSFAAGPTRCAMRSRISPAALFVNVTASIDGRRDAARQAGTRCAP